MLKRATVVGICCVLMGAAALPARAQTASVEDQLLNMINSVRSHDIVMHAGLRAVARTHSADMALAGSLSHKGAHGRVYGAAADPPESAGGPDTGFGPTWCEVVGWEPGSADENIARTFFSEWRSKNSDNACITNPDITAAGIGAYESGKKWWVTLEMVQDKTPPKPGAPSTTALASHSPAAVAPSSAPSTAAAGTGSSALGGSESASSSSGLGLREIAVAVLGFSVAPVLYTLRRRRAARR